jgi:glycosyltransferase involved in cell wall biosynthesis
MIATSLRPPAPSKPAAIALPRLALLRDYREEDWPSMQLCADMLAEQLRHAECDRLTLIDVCPPLRRRVQRLPGLGRRRVAFNADRLLNRLWDYPRHMRPLRDAAELFHVADHSYAHLVHAVPAERAGVFCHDLDAFRCLLEPARESRPRWFRAVTRRILAGLQHAALVFHSTRAVRDAIERHGLVDPARLVHAPYGFAPEFHPGDGEPPAERGAPYILHVGGCIPRKRIDVLLAVFCRLRERLPALRLVKVGGEWTAEQRVTLSRPGLADATTHVTGIDRRELAQLYRRARLVMMPSEAEGFGLPVLEALACGAIVLASDLPVLREVGGDVACYAPMGDVEAWTAAALDLLHDPQSAGPASERVRWADRFSWRQHARTIADAYLGLLR